MTVTHDFQLVDNCEDLSRWQANGVELSINNENYLEGSGAVNIYKTTTQDAWVSAYLNFAETLHPLGKIMLVYFYVTREAIRHITRFAIYLYSPSNAWASYGKKELLRPGWNPLVLPVVDTRLQDVTRMEFRFYMLGQLPEGNIVVDRIMLGTGYLVLYSTEQNPDTLMDIVDLDKRENLMLVDGLGENGYIVRGRIMIGNGTDTGTLEIKDSVVLFDAVNMAEARLFMGMLDVRTGSILDVENSMLVGTARSAYPYTAMILRAESGSIIRLKKAFLIDLAPLIGAPTTRYNMATNSLTLEDFGFNVMLWMYAVKGVQFTGNLYLLPGASMILDDYNYHDVMFPATPIILGGAEIAPRNSRRIGFRGLVVYGGRVRADSSEASIYDPVNMSKDNLIVGGSNSRLAVYYTIDIYVMDRYGSPLVGVTVNIYDKYGNSVASGQTDYNGHIRFTLKVYERATDDTGSVTVDEDYNPFTIEVLAAGGVIAKTRMIARNPMAIFVTPDNVYVMVTYPERSMVSIGEPVHIIAEIHKIDGTPVSGLDVYADVEKPDHSIATIVLYEDSQNPGHYIGEYALTDQAGNYRYRAYAVLENAMIEAYNGFYVGVIEQGFDKLMKKLRNIEALVSIGTLNNM